MNIVIIGLSITSSWGNGHATTYRGLARELCVAGHKVHFLERNTPWYSKNRDVVDLSPIHVRLYENPAELKLRFLQVVQNADAVVVGSYVPDGIEIGDWVLSSARGVIAFYDIDTPVTLAAIARDECAYITSEQISRYPLYLSFTGGPTLTRLETEFGSPMARALYCSVDPAAYFPQSFPRRWDLGYLGTYSKDRQPTLDRLLLQPASQWPEGRFVVAGPMYPETVIWPENVARAEHLPPGEHNRFYNEQRFTLNVTRADMIAAGYSPSVRLFEAAACGVPIISDYWDGLETFFDPRSEIVIADSAEEVLHILRTMPAPEAIAMAAAARRRVLKAHTAEHRAQELLGYFEEAAAVSTRQSNPTLSP